MAMPTPVMSDVQSQAHTNAPQGHYRSGTYAVYEDHERIRKLFADYKAATERPTKLMIVRMIVTAISQHASAEERTIYPMIMSRVDKGDGAKLLYDMMVMDDQINKEHLNYLETHVPDTEADWALYERQLAKFMAVEEEHLSKEEQEVLGRLSKTLTEQENDELYAQFETALKNAPLHPHPMGGTTGLAAKVLHPVAAAVDRATHAMAGTVQKVFGSSTEATVAHAGHELGRHV